LCPGETLSHFSLSEVTTIVRSSVKDNEKSIDQQVLRLRILRPELQYLDGIYPDLDNRLPIQMYEAVRLRSMYIYSNVKCHQIIDLEVPQVVQDNNTLATGYVPAHLQQVLEMIGFEGTVHAQVPDPVVYHLSTCGEFGLRFRTRSSDTSDDRQLEECWEEDYEAHELTYFD
jgi:hypothetical protein